MNITEIKKQLENIPTLRAQQEAKKQTEILRKRKELEASIYLLKERISDLIELGETCLKVKIPLTARYYSSDRTYEKGFFFSDSLFHQVGFRQREPGELFIGREGGGACHYSLWIDKEGNISCEGEDWKKCYEGFLAQFESFETSFLKYIQEQIKKANA